MTRTTDLFETLAARRRRYVLYCLLETDETSLRNLAGVIAAAESGRSVATVSPDRRRRTAADLADIHLPMLDANGLVEYDPETGTVELGDESERAVGYLDVASRHEPPPTATHGDA